MASERRWSGRDWATMAVVALVVVLIAAVIAGAVAVFGGDSGNAKVVLAPASQPGADPFTASVATGTVVALQPGAQAKVAATRRAFVTDPETHTLFATGTTPGLYGGSGNSRVCNPQQVVAFLRQNPQKQAAWAGVFGISSADVATYVGSLTPVLLTSDTLVTNHGYKDGHATSLQSVLQAGTAVMVDATGMPRVKCNCGNPLTAPEAIAPTDTTGTAWPGYSPTKVTVVRAGPPATSITVIDVTTGKLHPQPVGGRGTSGHGTNSGGGEFVALQRGAYSTSSDGTRWSPVGQADRRFGGGLTWANGKWFALRTNGTGGTAVLASADLRAWTELGVVPAYVADIGYGNGLWVVVGARPDNDDSEHGIVYTSTDARSWTNVATDLGQSLQSVTFGDGAWIAVDDGHQGGDPSATYRSSDGRTWTRQDDNGLDGLWGSHVAYGAGQWALGGSEKYSAANSTAPDGEVSVSADGNTWTPVANTPFIDDSVNGIAYGNGEWLLITNTGAVYSSPDAQVWTKRSAITSPSDLSFGGDTTAVTSTTTPPPATTTPAPAVTTTTVAAATSGLRSVNWRNSTYEDQACPTRGPIKLTNGAWYEPGTKGTYAECSVKLEGVYYEDLTGDGVEDAILRFHGSASPTRLGQSYWTTVFSTGPSGPVNRGTVSGPSFPPYSPATGIVVWVPDPQPGDIGECCPGKFELDTYKWSSPTETFVHTRTSYADDSAYPG